MEAIYLLEGARTPFGSFGGALKDTSAQELAVTAFKGAMERAKVEAADVDNVVLGNVIQTQKNAPYLSRHVALSAGIPIESPALTVNRLCGSGLQAVVSAAQAILLGESRLAVAGGTESMSQAPHALYGSRFGTGLKSPEIVDTLWSGLTDEYIGCGMGMTAENIAEQFKISREEQDEFALLSHRRAAKSRESGRLAKEIVPVVYQDRKGREIRVERDEHIRPETSLESLAKLKPSFKKEGCVTAGNASGINDGAAALVLAGESYVSRRGLKPIARLVSWAVAGVDPKIMGTGPIPASKLAAERAGLKISDIDYVEINEAFASQYISVERGLELNRERTNVNGGAIALGHPVGASGARILLSLAYELREKNGRYGLASLCIGGGQGIAAIIERV
jgi:acetyl-CoA C-acetyltransferase